MVALSLVVCISALEDNPIHKQGHVSSHDDVMMDIWFNLMRCNTMLCLMFTYFQLHTYIFYEG